MHSCKTCMDTTCRLRWQEGPVCNNYVGWQWIPLSAPEPIGFYAHAGKGDAYLPPLSYVKLHTTTAQGTEADVCDDIAKRQNFGRSKYGTTVRGNPLAFEQWLQHAYEECLDMAVYLKRAMEELKKGKEDGTQATE